MVSRNKNRHVLVQTSRFSLWVGAADIAAAAPRAAYTIYVAVVADTSAVTATAADIATVATAAANTASMPIVDAVGGIFRVCRNQHGFLFLP